ncbi:MAG: hypothetical protein HY396_01675 [Candidatus Doudnabacteria bacterium]|nr:hypothetical protein [Candidatus Doudnabacteria bacterium]
MSKAEIIAKALKKNGVLADFDPENRDDMLGYFLVIRQPGKPVFLVVDESGLQSHASVVAALRRLEVLPHMPGQSLPESIIRCIRGGTYSYNWIKTWPMEGNWTIGMSSGDYGVVWEDLRARIIDIVSGGKQWQK